MGLALSKTSVDRAVIVHAAAAPAIFALVSGIYFTYFGYSGALGTAAGFLAVVIMDVFVVALLIQRKFTMFRSVLGTWLPFALIFASTYIVGRLSGA
jgi:hypothetical protein